MHFPHNSVKLMPIVWKEQPATRALQHSVALLFLVYAIVVTLEQDVQATLQYLFA